MHVFQLIWIKYECVHVYDKVNDPLSILIRCPQTLQCMNLVIKLNELVKGCVWSVDSTAVIHVFLVHSHLLAI